MGYSNPAGRPLLEQAGARLDARSDGLKRRGDLSTDHVIRISVSVLRLRVLNRGIEDVLPRPLNY